jgi:hypothetical protein
MVDEKKERNKWVDGVARMIELTQQGKMRWAEVEPQSTTDEEENRTSAIFQSIFNGRNIRLYQKKVRVRTVADELAKVMQPKQKITPTYRRIGVLELVNAEGATLWKYPEVDALNDLLTAVQYQVAGVNDFLNDIFSETDAVSS